MNVEFTVEQVQSLNAFRVLEVVDGGTPVVRVEPTTDAVRVYRVVLALMEVRRKQGHAVTFRDSDDDFS